MYTYEFVIYLYPEIEGLLMCGKHADMGIENIDHIENIYTYILYVSNLKTNTYTKSLLKMYYFPETRSLVSPYFVCRYLNFVTTFGPSVYSQTHFDRFRT